MTNSRPRRWSAYALAALFLGYAVGKAAFALQSRLGFPGGPPVSAAETESYFMDPAVGQWFAFASGVLGAGIAIATVTKLGRRIPKPLMVTVLIGMLLAVLGGGGIMALDGFIGIGVGWEWYFGIIGLLAIALSLDMTRSYLVVTRRVAH